MGDELKKRRRENEGKHIFKSYDQCKGCHHCVNTSLRLDRLEGNMQLVLQKLNGIFETNQKIMESISSPRYKQVDEESMSREENKTALSTNAHKSEKPNQNSLFEFSPFKVFQNNKFQPKDEKEEAVSEYDFMNWFGKEQDDFDFFDDGGNDGGGIT